MVLVHLISCPVSSLLRCWMIRSRKELRQKTIKSCQKVVVQVFAKCKSKMNDLFLVKYSQNTTFGTCLMCLIYVYPYSCPGGESPRFSVCNVHAASPLLLKLATANLGCSPCLGEFPEARGIVRSSRVSCCL